MYTEILIAEDSNCAVFGFNILYVIFKKNGMYEKTWNFSIFKYVVTLIVNTL